MQIKLVSYNIFYGMAKEQVVKNICDLADQGANVFCLQEVRPSQNGEFIGDLILERLGPAWKGEFFLNLDPKHYRYGLAMIWNSEVTEPVRFDNLLFETQFRSNLYEQARDLVLRKIKPVQKGALIGMFDVGGEIVRISNIHMDWLGRFDLRSKQLVQLTEYLRSTPPVHNEIICGDFNTLGLSNSGQIKKIHEILGSEFVNLFPEFTITTLHYQHLDHIFAKNFTIHEALVHEVVGSDHYPIMASLSLDKPRKLVEIL